MMTTPLPVNAKAHKCPRCKGTGDVAGNPSYGPCDLCGGRGWLAAPPADTSALAATASPEVKQTVTSTEVVAWQWHDFSGNWYTVDSAVSRTPIEQQEEIARACAEKHGGRVRALVPASSLEASEARAAGLVKERDDIDLFWKPRVEQLDADLAKEIRDNVRLKTWVADLQSGMYVNCVYCGHRYGPGETTPVSMADALKAHIEVCPEHPLSHEKAAREAAESALLTSQAETREALRKLELARVALKPFAEAAEHVPDEEEDFKVLASVPGGHNAAKFKRMSLSLTAGNFRAASRALNGEGEKN
jgi:hypothetical protein